MSIGTFIIVRNESEYIGYHIMSLLSYVDEMVFSDGNSTDGTIEIIKYIKDKYDKDDKIKLFLDKDCKNLQEDYVSLFDWTLKQVKSDYAWFIHPDMICINPEVISKSLESKAVRYFVNIESIAGENKEKRFICGRDKRWASIYRNAYGLHYAGYYGTVEEDCYFEDFTGTKHQFWKTLQYLPYEIVDTDINLVHYCDCKPYQRRYERMLSCLKNIYKNDDVKKLEEEAKIHPRVSLKDGRYGGFDFIFSPNTFKPEVFEKYKAEFEPLRRS